MNSVKELIYLISKNPAVYLGKESISCLRSFLDGWFFRNPEGVNDLDVMVDFQDWIEKKYEIKTSHSWDRIILFYSQDENAALKNFFKLFMQRNP